MSVIKTLNKTTSGRIKLFFKGTRSINRPSLYEHLNTCSIESVVDTFVTAFYFRDCRGGKGERDLGRSVMKWLFLQYPDNFMKIVHLIPEYGRWDDIMSLWPGVFHLQYPKSGNKDSWLLYINNNFDVNIKTHNELVKIQSYQLEIVRLMGNQLNIDMKLAKEGKPISMCCKWAPTEKDSMDRKFHTVLTLCKEMKWTCKQYRKQYTSQLRIYAKIVEGLMCKKQWDTIDFNKVSSHAMRRLKAAFLKNTRNTFIAWSVGLTAKVNDSQFMPHEIIKEIRAKGYADRVLEEQWRCLERGSKHLNDSIAVVDTSSSMTTKQSPIDVALGLGLLIANTSQGPFHNQIITFSNSPTYITIPDSSIFERYDILRESGWAGSTNLQATFDLILDRAQKFKITTNYMPKRIFILTDMCFNSADGYGIDERVLQGEKTNLKIIDVKYKNAGYTRPNIIFWDVRGDGNDFTVSTNKSGSTLISGFSPTIMSAILNGDTLDCWDIVNKILHSGRYDPIYNCLRA